MPHKEAHQVIPTHVQPSCILQLCKENINNTLSLSEVDLSHLKRETTNMDPISWNLTGEETLIQITHQQQNIHPASWKLTGEETLIPTTHQVDACSCKMTGEEKTI